ncbi:putative mucin-like protein [Phytophthora cinnamomi]|uniref:putative mucin-like protein n=1 Tax=Phytophthora cinnamomi TaxID=4785 RepID=UPI00355A0D24|nr:putative mucin-like protein [Phytophthora cinnamomi]
MEDSVASTTNDNGSGFYGNGSAAGDETISRMHAEVEATSSGGVSAGGSALSVSQGRCCDAIKRGSTQGVTMLDRKVDGLRLDSEHRPFSNLQRRVNSFQHRTAATAQKAMKISAITTLAAAMLASAAAANNVTSTTNTTTTTTTSGCWDVSVEHDATYCIEGPICSGSGLEPEGSLCPTKGAVATADCHDYLASYGGEGSCVLPVDSTCQIIKTGAWGCVLSSSSSASGEGTTDAGETGSASGSSAVTATVLAAEAPSTSSGLSGGAVGAIAAAAGCVAAVAGFTLYKQYQKHSAEAAERARLETFVDVVTP